jgi:hypothetical protein
MEQSPSWETNRFSASQGIPHILNNGSSLLGLQENTTCPCSKPDQSITCPNPTSWRAILILSYHLRLGLSSGHFPLCFPIKSL